MAWSLFITQLKGYGGLVKDRLLCLSWSDRSQQVAAQAVRREQATKSCGVPKRVRYLSRLPWNPREVWGRGMGAFERKICVLHTYCRPVRKPAGGQALG